jgi:hypothetical protein
VEKNKYEKKISVWIIPWSLHTKDNLQSLATKKANISELLFLRKLPKCMISQRFSCIFLPVCCVVFCGSVFAFFSFCPMSCLPFLDLWLLINPLESSNCSYFSIKLLDHDRHSDWVNLTSTIRSENTIP